MASTEDMLDQLCVITGLERDLAANLLEACDQNLEMALNMHMENGDLEQQQQEPLPGPSQHQHPQPGPSQQQDDVRAPIPQKQETLVQPGFEGYQMNNRLNRVAHQRRVRSVFDGFRNFEAETRRLEDGEREPPGYSRSKKKTLEELFKPPLDIMHQADWQSTRDHAVNTNRWLLVNIQDPKEFQCQVLNRDLWSSPGVKTIIREHFVFWQQYKETDEAERYMTFYRIAQWPYIAIIDPRTGENMVTWSHIEADGFPELITEFLSLHPTLDSPAREPPRKRARYDADGDQQQRLTEMDEEAQLAAAIRASLEETLQKKNKKQDDDVDDLAASDDDNRPSSPFSSSPRQPPVHLQTNGHVARRLSSSSAAATEPDILINGDALHSDQNGPCHGNKDGAGKDSPGSNGDAGWEAYLGSGADSTTNIVIRYPDGGRDAWRQPATSQLRALVLFLAAKGFHMDRYELVTNFPRRVLSQLDLNKSLQEHGLFPQETVFVQLKD